MAKVIIELEDIVGEDGSPGVSFASDLGKEGDKLTQAALMAIAIHKLFNTHWLGQNIPKIIPEMFVETEKEENAEV